MHQIMKERITDRFKLNLMRRRAARLGLCGADLDDVQQEVALRMAAFQLHEGFDNEDAAFAALVNFSNLYLQTAKRNQQRYYKSLDRIKRSMESRGCDSEGESDPNDLERIDRDQDIQTTLSTLSLDDKELCQALMAGESIDSIAQRLKCGWHTVGRRIRRLRSYFREMGLDGYVRK